MKNSILIYFMLLMILCSCSSRLYPVVDSIVNKNDSLISEVQQFNVKLIDEYFDCKRAQIESYVLNTWTNILVLEYTNDSTLTIHCDSLVNKGDYLTLTQYLQGINPLIIDELNSEMSYLNEPLNRLEDYFKLTTLNYYNELILGNYKIRLLLLNKSRLKETNPEQPVKNSSNELVEKQTRIDSAIPNASNSIPKNRQQARTKSKSIAEELNAEANRSLGTPNNEN